MQITSLSHIQYNFIFSCSLFAKHVLTQYKNHEKSRIIKYSDILWSHLTKGVIHIVNCNIGLAIHIYNPTIILVVPHILFMCYPIFPWSLYSLIWDSLLSQINIWTATTCSNIWVVLPKPSWYELLIGFLIWTPTSKYLHLTAFSNICVILSMFLYL